MGDRALLWLVAGYFSLQPLSTDLYLGSLPHLAQYFHAGASAAQATLSVFVIGFGFSQLLAGPLSDRLGRRPVALGGCVLYVLASLSCAMASTMPWLVYARLVQAVGCCCAIVAARTIIRDSYEPAAGAAVIARASSIFALVPLLGPVVGGYTQIWFGWRAAFAVQTGFGLMLLVVSLRWLRETNRQPDHTALHPAQLLRTYLAVASTPAFWRYALPGACTYGAIFVFIAGSSFAFIDVLHVPTERYGLCFAFSICGYLLGTLRCRTMLRRHSLAVVLRLGTWLTGLAGLALWAIVAAGYAHWIVLLAAQFVVMTAHGLNQPCAQAGVVAPFASQAGAATGLFGFMTMAVALAVGTLLGLSHDDSLGPISTMAAAMGVLTWIAARAPARFTVRSPV